MRTSAIRHPKYEHAITIHSWMMKITEGNLYAATLLGYLESKFNILLDAKEKNNGWMKLKEFQVKNGMFASTFNDMNMAIEILETLDLILVNRLYDSKAQELKSGEISIKLDALRINEWLDMYCKNTDTKMGLLEYMPFLGLLLINYQMDTVDLNDNEDQLEFELKPPEPKTRRKATSNKPTDNPVTDSAYMLFNFWKVKTGHKKSNLSDRDRNLIMKRLGDGYSEAQIAHATIGISFSQHHVENKYDYMYYVVRQAAMLDRFIAFAIKEGITEEQANLEYSEVKRKLDNNEELVYESKRVFKNPTTGKELV